MKIFQINTVCGVGSTGHIVLDIDDVLQGAGHNCMIAYGRGPAPDRKHVYRIGSNWDIIQHGVFTRITDRHGFASCQATKELIKTMEAYAPDMIHLHNLHGYYLNIEILFHWLRSCGIPIIWTLHDCWAYTGHCAHYSYAKCTRWRIQCTSCPQKKEYPASFFWDASQSNYKRKKDIFTGIPYLYIVTPSRWLAGEVKKSFLSAYPVHFISNGIDLTCFRPIISDYKERNGIGNKIMLLGVANNWNTKKGYEEFKKLADRLDARFEIVLVGLTQKQSKGLHRNMRGIPRTNNAEELAVIYSAADVFINPSREETMGLVTVEALACGTPAIVYPCTAVPETVDALSGIVVQDIEQLVQEISALSFHRISSESCINRAKDYDKHKQYMKYLELYMEAVG